MRRSHASAASEAGTSIRFDVGWTDRRPAGPSRGPGHGHPVVFGRALLAALRRADPAAGARPVVRAHEAEAEDVVVDDAGAFTDIDTPEDYRRAFGAPPPDETISDSHVPAAGAKSPAPPAVPPLVVPRPARGGRRPPAPVRRRCPHVTESAATMIRRRATLFALLAVAAAAPAEAQLFEAFDENRWGVHLSYTPEWQTPDAFRHFLGADGIVDWRGSDYSIGFVRGRARGREWGLAFIRQRVAADSLLCLAADDAGGCYDPVEATGDLRLQGFRVQVGVNAAAGAGWYQGSVLRANGGGGRWTSPRCSASAGRRAPRASPSRSRCSGSSSASAPRSPRACG